MADSFTPELNLTKVGINESENTWGNKLNDNCDKIDAGVVEDRAEIAALKARCDDLEEEAAKASWVGEIRMHSGSVASIDQIPGGVWKLCNGQNGTVNLIDRFVVAAGGAYAPGATGGAASWTGSTGGWDLSGLRTFGTALAPSQMPRHKHSVWTGENGNHEHIIGWRQIGEGGGAGRQLFAPFDATGSSGSGFAGNHAHGADMDEQGNNEQHDHAMPDITHGHTVSVLTMPPYFALCYVQRVA